MLSKRVRARCGRPFPATAVSTSADRQRGAGMGRIVVSENISLDGVVQDPTGDEGLPFGGWFGRGAGPGPGGVRRAPPPGGARHAGAAAGSPQPRMVRHAVGVARRRLGGPAERHAEVRRLHLARARLDQLDGPERRRGGRGLPAEAGERGRHRRVRQPPALCAPCCTRPRRRGCWSTRSSSAPAPTGSSAWTCPGRSWRWPGGRRLRRRSCSRT